MSTNDAPLTPERLDLDDVLSRMDDLPEWIDQCSEYGLGHGAGINANAQAKKIATALVTELKAAREREVKALAERDRLALDALMALAGVGATTSVEGYVKAPWCLMSDIERLGLELQMALERESRHVEALESIANASGGPRSSSIGRDHFECHACHAVTSGTGDRLQHREGCTWWIATRALASDAGDPADAKGAEDAK